MAATDRLMDMLEPVIAAMGYELVGVDYHPNTKRGLLRVYIDAAGGVDVDDCAQVSHQVSGVLDVEDPIPGEFNLEVSSPGLDRPIFKASDYERFAGENVRLRMRGRYEGRRKFHGTLRGLRGDQVVISEQGVEIAVPREFVERANLDLKPNGR